MAKGPLVDYEAARRNALYAAAWMFLKLGYTETSLRGVAREANISLSALLRVFGSKEGLHGAACPIFTRRRCTICGMRVII